MRSDPARPVAGDVAWHDASAGAASALARHVRSLLGPGAVSSGRLCPSCGSGGHGRPWVRLDGRRVHVSLARSGPHLVTAIAEEAVGVDVEAPVVDVLPELVHAPAEAGDLARAWTRKEAVLKARGSGLSTPMPTVVLAQECWWDLDAPDGYVAALAVTRPVPARRECDVPLATFPRDAHHQLP